MYNNPNCVNGNANGQHVHTNGSNTALLQRITSPWTEGVFWNIHPTTTTQNQVILPQDTNPNQNYQLDVKLLLQDIIANPSQGYGFMLKLQDETPYKLLAFASSDHPNPSLHPKLEITYSFCTIIQPDATIGKDAFLSDNVSNGQPNSPEFNAGAWTISGTPLKIRGLLDFNLSTVPTGTSIDSAILTLYNNPNSQNGNANGQHVHSSGSNAAYLRRIITPWDENVSWNNQLAVTTVNQVVLPQDTTPFQDYNVDVKLLIQDIIANPSQGYGLMLQLQNESPYRLLTFASSDHPNSNLHPKLEICYTPNLSYKIII
ncbi:MAG: DNRLRE domain-containing protein [Flavobacterium sp.]|nr:DNRLRE domain-containing protein [Flavobacterium sp.]